MEVFKTVAGYRTWRNSLPANRTVGFAPTMGALHAGHMRLVEVARKLADETVVSIFVNPLQFGPAEDFSRYPRPFETDSALCRAAGVSAIFAPEPGDFYPSDFSTHCDVDGLDQHLCGASRPDHFRGVCTVVLKLFNIIQPQVACFGQKDIQQALILRRMVEDLSLNLDFQIVETVRESSGLAMSSRNAYLSDDEKMRATAIYKGLTQAKAAWAQGEKDATVLKRIIRASIDAAQPTRVDYVEAVSQARLAPIDRVEGPSVLAAAVYFGKTRLIDNLLLN